MVYLHPPTRFSLRLTAVLPPPLSPPPVSPFVHRLRGDEHSNPSLVETRCEAMMEQLPYEQEVLARGVKKVRSGVPKRYGNMKLQEYCKTFGEDYEEILFAALSPREAEALLAEHGGEGGGKGRAEDDGVDENNPG